jgi:hypothetical protein
MVQADSAGMGKHLFTSENARYFSELGNAAIAAQKQAMRDAVLSACVSTEEDYTKRRLARVRLQLDAVDAQIAGEQVKGTPDAKRLKELIEAQSRLNIQERELSMRPAPGTTKPKADRVAPRGTFVPPPPEDDV